MNGRASDFGTNAAGIERVQIQQLFEAQAARTPEAQAVCHGSDVLSYRGLNERANQLARYLQRLGVSGETPVALCLERSIDMVVAIVGVLKAGGTYVPIDLAYPKERAAFMLEDSQAPVLLTQHSLLPSLPEFQGRIVCMDREWESISGESVENVSNKATPESAAYVIFTSGSTGKPKGVLVTHHNIVRLFTSTQHWFEFCQSDVWTLFHSYAFDFSVWELWGALIHGGKLVVVPYLASRSPSEFFDLIAREKVTVLNQTPSAFRQLIEAEGASGARQALHLRYVIFGGEALELQSLRPWFERHGDQRPKLINMYGITETTVHVTYRQITLCDLDESKGSVIGVPIPDLRIYLLDGSFAPVPDGVPGEIFIGGKGVARGYLNRPELNRERFVPDPFSGDPSARLYRSGDLARKLPGGDLEYLGRIDHQIKIRGFRIELGEIESMLNQHPAVRESIVLALNTKSNEKRLAAYVVARGSATGLIGELREHLARKLPDYMIPAAYVFLPSLPLTPNGKVDRKALPEPDRARPALRAAYAAPHTDVEMALATIWSASLEIEPVGIHDNFFELGGDSIRAIALLSRMQQAGYSYKLEHLFKNPTIAGLALSRAGNENKSTVSTAPFSLVSAEDMAKLPPGLDDAYPMIKLQTGMFYYNEINPASAVYHDVFSFRIAYKYDGGRLREAMARLLKRHPILRTSFHIGEFGEPMQLVHSSAEASCGEEDLRGRSPEQQTAALANYIEREKRVAFDRKKAPLFRVHIQLLGQRAFQIIISFHHVCLDGWSLAALLAEVLEDYAALLQGTELQIAPPRIAYRDFVALEREAIASEDCRNFWKNQIADAGVRTLPRWPKEMMPGGLEQVRGPEIELDAATLEKLRDLAASTAVPLKTVLLAAHQRVMAFLYGQTDVISGLICNGRPEELDGEKIIGLFLNTLPLRVKAAGGSWEELIKATHAAEQAIIPNRRFPLAEIQDLNGGQPLFEAAFDFVHFHVYKTLQGCQDMDFLEDHYFEANNLATLTTFMLDTTSTRLQFHIDYDPNLLCHTQVEEMSRYYLAAIEAMVSNPRGRYERTALLAPDEHDRILCQWNNTAVEYPSRHCVHQLFEEQAARTPNAQAVDFECQRTRYAELDARATEIAAALARNGVGPEVLVGIFLERSTDMLAAMLGALKAGGAYVPLDPSYPRERLAQILSDARTPVILTTTALAPRLPQTEAILIPLDQPLHGGEFVAPGNLSSKNLAYVIYTSGSTGKPKGVQIAHRSLVNLLLSMAGTTRITQADRLLAVTTFAFDIAGLELFMPLICGGQVIIASKEAASDGMQLCSLLQSVRPSVMQGTPATWRMLIESGWAGDRLIKIFCGGEALSRTLADALLARAGEVWNVYGPTETTVWSSAWKVAPSGPCLIGRPLGNTQIHILDSNLLPVPPGVVGEIHIGGDGLARGYVNLPALTAEKFINNPFDHTHCARLYKTGDLGRYLPDGQIECLGRLDQQVKIRGFRIELSEVEAGLRRNPAISEAMVLAREDSPGERRLVAYIVPRAGEVPTQSQIRESLQAILPEYMIPSACVFLHQFPLTPAGKIDRKALPVPESALLPATRRYVAPRSSLESGVAGIWQEVFHISPIGIEDSFFDLGGHSLTAIRVIARIRDRFGIEIPLSALLSAPTIKGLVQAILVQLQTTNEEFDAIFSEIDELTDEQAKVLLSSAQ